MIPNILWTFEVHLMNLLFCLESKKNIAIKLN
jgi:hypothetical protein